MLPLKIPEYLKSRVSSLKKSKIDNEKVAINGKHILIVEDSADNQLLFSRILLKSGAQVKIAPNGQIGVEIALRENFDIILMDMQMPVLDGYSAIKQLREKSYIKPIIGLTAHAMKDDIKKCLAAGANEVLTKPIDRNKLLETLSHYSQVKNA